MNTLSIVQKTWIEVALVLRVTSIRGHEEYTIDVVVTTQQQQYSQPGLKHLQELQQRQFFSEYW
jgi:hypothetical protein